MTATIARVNAASAKVTNSPVCIILKNVEYEEAIKYLKY